MEIINWDKRYFIRQKKEILMNLITRLRFEENIGSNKPEEILRTITIQQFLREFCLYFIYMTTGPFSLLVLLPIS